MYVCVLECANGIHSGRHMITITCPFSNWLQRSVAGGRSLVSHISATSSESPSNYLNLKSRCVHMCVCVCVYTLPVFYVAVLCLSVSEHVCVQ